MYSLCPMADYSMKLETRVTIVAQKEGASFTRADEFGIEWQADHAGARNHPKVRAYTARMAANGWTVSKITFRDC